MRRILLIVSLLMVLSATPALAITHGELDGNGHPMVGIMVAKDDSGAPMWRCSGTMISKRVFVTAGHCTESPAASAEIWFDPMLQDHQAASRYPNNGEYSGTPHTYPAYDTLPWWMADVGVVVLDEDYDGATASLVGINELDRYARKAKKNKAWFTAVGYGLQKAFPDAAAWRDAAEKYRMVSYPKLIQINVKGSVGSTSLILSNNAHTGGTCFGDSGGPNFLKDSTRIAGVTSFGKNPTCGGQGGVFRLDRKGPHDWVRDMVAKHG